MKKILAALAVTLLVAPAFGQDAPKLDPRYHMTPDQVSKDKPFGDIKVDTAMTGEAAIPDFFHSLTPEQFGELQGRCGVIVQDESNYQATDVTWCKLFIGAVQKAPANN